MAWLRNKKTGGWFEIPDEQLDTNKYMNQKIKQALQKEIITAKHITKKKNINSIIKNGFNLDNVGKGGGKAFGKGVYFAQDEKEQIFYQDLLGSKESIEADIDTRGFLKLELNGSQTGDQLYKTIVSHFTEAEQKEYRKRVRQIKQENLQGNDYKPWPEKEAANEMLESHYPRINNKAKHG